MADITIYASIIKNISDWIEDQVCDDYPTKKVSLNFSTNELELYDYESGIIESRRPLIFFK